MPSTTTSHPASSPRAIDPATLLLAGGGVVIVGVGAFLLRDPEIRRVGMQVLTDAEVHDAVKRLGGSIAAAWHRSGGTEAVVSSIRRFAASAPSTVA